MQNHIFRVLQLKIDNVVVSGMFGSHLGFSIMVILTKLMDSAPWKTIFLGYNN